MERENPQHSQHKTEEQSWKTLPNLKTYYKAIVINSV